MSVKQFPSQALMNLLYGWETYYWLIFQDIETGKYYRAEYSEGNTEMQDSMFFGENGQLVDCVEVVPKEVTIVKYEAVD